MAICPKCKRKIISLIFIDFREPNVYVYDGNSYSTNTNFKMKVHNVEFACPICVETLFEGDVIGEDIEGQAKDFLLKGKR